MNLSITETSIAKNMMKNISKKSLKYYKHITVNTMNRNLNLAATLTKEAIKEIKTHFQREKDRNLLLNKI